MLKKCCGAPDSTPRSVFLARRSDNRNYQRDRSWNTCEYHGTDASDSLSHTSFCGRGLSGRDRHACRTFCIAGFRLNSLCRCNPFISGFYTIYISRSDRRHHGPFSSSGPQTPHGREGIAGRKISGNGQPHRRFLRSTSCYTCLTDHGPSPEPLPSAQTISSLSVIRNLINSYLL